MIRAHQYGRPNVLGLRVRTGGNDYTRISWSARVEIYDTTIDVPAACGSAMRLLCEGGHSHGAVSSLTGLGAKSVGIVAGAISQRGAAAGEGGWESLPSAAKFSLIKSEYYPTPTADTWIMARLHGEGAVGPDSAVRMFEDRAMRDLAASGHVCKSPGGKFYLADSGARLAREVVDAYPEIGWGKFLRPGGSRNRARELVGMTVPMAPPALGAVQRGEPAQ